MKNQTDKSKPIVSVFRSNRYIYAQVLENGRVIESSSSLGSKNKDKITKTDKAKSVGIDLAKKLLRKKIKSVIIKRGKYLYLGRIKALAEGLREGGLKI